MSRQGELNSYIRQVQQRLRLGAGARGAAVLLAAALVTTLALVLTLNAYAFPVRGLTGARVALLVVLGVTAVLALILPVMRLNRRRSVAAAEAARPELEQRLTTFSEREQAGNDPFIELLAADTLKVARDAGPEVLVPNGRLLALVGAGAGCLAVLVWMIAAGPGYVGYGASLLWTGPKHDVAPMYDIRVSPGDVAVRRHSDQLITAEVIGVHSEQVRLFTKYDAADGKATAKSDKVGWEPVVMQAIPAQAGVVPTSSEAKSGGGSNFQFLLSGLPESVEYYVEAGPVTSKHYKVRVVDLPSVQQVQVTYHYPKWTGLKQVSEEHGGDLRAIEGTEAEIEVKMDRPLQDGVLALDDGQKLKMSGGEGNRYRGTIQMAKDGAYHVAAVDQGQQVRLSEDYFIATNKANPPEIAIDRPTGDYKASPIEEVTIGVRAGADFGLNQVELHYSVNGGAEQKVNVLKSAGAKTADGTTTLRLEDFKLVPGDLVTLYATARDGHAEAKTEMAFIQAEPFEREFSQSQQSGGGGGGGGGGGQQGNQTDISKREKELIAATWKQFNAKGKAIEGKDATDAGKFLSEVQVKLREQVQALSGRMQSRDLSVANEEFTAFEKDMQAASAAMVPSSDKLKQMQWKDAIPAEQKALQYLLRAEATFRQIQVAFGQQKGGGGGGGGGSAGRDLASLFDLEMDTEKNQYETAQSASPAEQKAKEVDDALAKLDALARRQEELAQKQATAQNATQSFEQRWQQETLRRDAERLEKQMQQMAEAGQKGQQGGQQSGGQQQGGQQGGQQAGGQQGGGQNSGQGGQQSASGSQQGGGQQQGSPGGSKSGGDRTDPRVAQALNRLRQADEAMKQGASGSQQQASEAARRAAEQLRQATNLMSGTQQQQSTGKLDSLARDAGRISQEEKAQAERIRGLSRQTGGSGAGELSQSDVAGRLAERNRLAEERQKLSDELSQLEKGMRDTARSLASNQPGAASKVRDALNGMDQADLGNKVQRTADWLRRGIDPNSNGTEAGIGTGLQKLQDQLREAQQGMGPGKLGQTGAGQGTGRTGEQQTAALGHVDRLRGQLEALAGRGSGAGQGKQPGQGQGQQGNGQQPGQKGQSGGQQGGKGQQAGGGQGQQAGGGQAGGGQPGGGQPGSGQGGGGQPGIGGQAGNRDSGGIRRGGDIAGTGARGGEGATWGNVNTGNNRFDSTGRRLDGPENRGSAGGEQAYREGLTELSQLRQLAKNDPAALKEIQDLVKEMQQLDPSRFQGNPAMVEQLHSEVLSGVDKLELQLRRNADEEAQVRSTKPVAVQQGYQDAVADYYRRLSKGK
jgi:hypothetical protein